jgi:hypothetical protein
VRVHKGLKGQEDQEVLRDHKVLKVLKVVYKVQQEFLDLQVHKVLKVLKDLQVEGEDKVLKEL